jgi:hypothetical protein
VDRQEGVVMGMAELNQLIAYFSRDPANDEAMERARWYAVLRDSMYPTAPADDATDDAGREVA